MLLQCKLQPVTADTAAQKGMVQKLEDALQIAKLRVGKADHNSVLKFCHGQHFVIFEVTVIGGLLQRKLSHLKHTASQMGSLQICKDGFQLEKLPMGKPSGNSFSCCVAST